ncbi:MAG: hypothetical protein KF822_07300 [Steroidobacteraceae bacterium]|nr:hypothetical protein [Steroidobacteraceae bacterium]
MERAAGGKLLAIGRLDRTLRDESRALLLGQDFQFLASAANARFLEQASIGLPVALFGDIVDGTYLVESALVLDGQYVQGASKVYLRGHVSSLDRRTGGGAIGAMRIDASSLMYEAATARLGKGSLVAIVGTQPSIEGAILVERVARVRPEARTATGNLDASVGTGSPEASVGTGSPEASVGTGSPEASVGTGSPEASVGTGSPEASVGTGSPEASVGTGSPEASVGTGSPEASVGTGSSAS